PVDLHPDHPVAGTLTLQAWARSSARPALYFYEACIGQQTRVFSPTDYVDITPVQELKTKAVYCHRSQFTAATYAGSNHPLMEAFRGAECGVTAAEAFVRLAG
ncbi:MAG: PIG-L family deacetylase, partial [Opitutaceae bacterium]|nr:PIG-L family deacetylase [Opitutaceae bacterium]